MKTYTISSWNLDDGQRYIVFDAETNEQIANFSEDEFAGSKYDEATAQANAQANAETQRERRMFPR